MPADSEIQYFRCIESGWVYAAVGLSGSAGLFQCSAEMKDWEYLIPGTQIWNWVHQKIFRNYRADAVTPEKFGFPFPGPPKHPSSEAIQQRLAALEKPLLAADYPRVTAFVNAQPGRSAELFAVLHEDWYESLLGDGKFFDFHKVFLNKTDTENYIRESGEYYYLRKFSVDLDGESSLCVKLQVEPWDTYKAEQVLKALEVELSAQRSAR